MESSLPPQEVVFEDRFCIGDHIGWHGEHNEVPKITRTPGSCPPGHHLGNCGVGPWVWVLGRQRQCSAKACGESHLLWDQGFCPLRMAPRTAGSAATRGWPLKADNLKGRDRSRLAWRIRESHGCIPELGIWLWTFISWSDDKVHLLHFSKVRLSGFAWPKA